MDRGVLVFLNFDLNKNKRREYLLICVLPAKLSSAAINFSPGPRIRRGIESQFPNVV